MRRLITLALTLLGLPAAAQNLVSTFSGTGAAGFMDGPIASAQFRHPFGICRGNNGIIYVADNENNRVRKIENGLVATLAGTGVAGWQDGPALTAQFNEPACLCVDDSNNVYVTDFAGQRVRKISYTGVVSTIAGTGVEGYLDGADSIARFDYPRGIALDAAGNLYIADSWNHRIRKIDGITHEVSTYVGGGAITGVQTPGGYVDAGDTSARFHTPTGVVVDSMGNLYVADALNHRIRKVDTQRQVTTVAGSGTSGAFLDGGALSARLNTPTDLFIAANGDIYIGDTYNNRVRVLGGGMLWTHAGSVQGYLNGPALSAAFNYPRGITATPGADSIWVIDWNNHGVRLIAPAPVAVSGGDGAELSVYPNPVHDRLRVRLPENAGFTMLTLTDMLGKVVDVKEGLDELEMKMGGLPPGMYVLNVRFEGAVLSRKVVKE